MVFVIIFVFDCTVAIRVDFHTLFTNSEIIVIENPILLTIFLMFIISVSFALTEAIPVLFSFMLLTLLSISFAIRSGLSVSSIYLYSALDSVLFKFLPLNSKSFAKLLVLPFLNPEQLLSLGLLEIMLIQ